MKKIILSIITILITSLGYSQKNWNLDKAHSSISFSISHMKISEVIGTFNNFDVTAETTSKFDNAIFDVTIDVSSIDTNQNNRDSHLKSPDFFDIKKFPEIKFKSEKFEKSENNEFTLIGKITLRGITKEITFKGKLNNIISGHNGKEKAGLSLSTVISRDEFKIGSKMVPIGDDVHVTINMELNQQ